MRLFLVLFLMLWVSGCASYVPEEEMVIAEAAIKAARTQEAHTVAPQLFQRAEESYRLAKRAFEDREYDLAKSLAIKARDFAEKAENTAVLKQQGKTGP